MSRTLERAAAALPEMRHQLFTAYGRTLIHGDAHPGNVLLRRGTALLIDWGRARAGSPLEDVSSWVQTLGVWEPEARRGHDTLLARYVRARDLGHGLDGHLRQAHWIAGASNALAGALRYHLFVISDRSQTPRRRVDSWRAVAHWLRIIRRADACWRA
jgi:aminoglycoside phosphotransferase (APT) family kinase protein